MLIRGEFELVLVELKRYRENGYGGMVISGQPGIGKSFSLIYILVMRILDGKPTIFQAIPEIAFLFCDHGVFSFVPSTWAVGGIKEPCKTLGITLDEKDGPLLLVDSSGQLISPPTYSLHQLIFIVHASNQTVSSAVDEDWIEKIQAPRYFMAPWSWSEIVTGNLLQRSPVETSFLQKVFELLPPSASICYHTKDEKGLQRKLGEV